MEAYAKEHLEELFQLIRDIAPIPAPSHQEDARVAWVKKYLEDLGAEGIYVDGKKNVIWPYHVTEDNDVAVIMAHTDVVFPDLTTLPFKEDDEYMYCPGVSDDTARLAALLMTARYFIENKIEPKMGILFVANSCEEGLGNSEGAQEMLKNFGKRIKYFVSNDGGLNTVVMRAVGSHRYEVTIKTPGGHSWGAFGNKNAIVALSELIQDLCKVQLPVKEDCRTTFNVGTIEGGTSVNTICQEAKMLYEYRSDDKECLAYMQEFFEKTIEEHKTHKDVTLDVKLLGARPCNGDLDMVHQKELAGWVEEAMKETHGLETRYRSGSTDSNFPLSLGIPSVTIGSCTGIGAHTRGEKVEKASIYPGFRYFMDFVGHFFQL